MGSQLGLWDETQFEMAIHDRIADRRGERDRWGGNVLGRAAVGGVAHQGYCVFSARP
jgi:hypothetical protein